LILRNKYIEMHGQQNIKKLIDIVVFDYIPFPVGSELGSGDKQTAC
jgi:hypothetical protein